MLLRLTMTSPSLSVTTGGEAPDEIRALIAPSAASAAERAVEAAQRIVVERLELLRLETQEALARSIQRAGLVLAAGFIATLGWCGLAIGLVLVLAEQMPLAVAVALVGGVHVLSGIVLGVAVGASGKRRTP